MRILAIDQSLTATGLAVIEDGKFELLDVIRPKTVGHERLHHIVTTCVALAGDADAVAVEAPALSMRGSASTGALFGLFGVLTHALWSAGREPIVVNPTHRAAYATGNGNANKDQVRAAAIRRYDDERLVDNNVIDAAVIGALVARVLGSPICDEVNLPAKALDVLTKIVMPDSLTEFVPDTIRESQAWAAVGKRVDKSTLKALQALPDASPTYAHALIDYATERGFAVWPNQRYVTCLRRLDAPTHSCGAKKCATEWATPTNWQHPVLLRGVDGERWAILEQNATIEHGLPAPVGQGRRAVLHTAMPVIAGASV